MANVIRLKRASGSDPAASDLVSGEPAVRTDTGELFFKKDDGSIAKVAGAGGGPDFKYLALRNAANNGAASFPNADFTLVTSGTTSAITPTAANTLLVSVNGVIQKPNTGTSTPSQGFALSGSTIKFGANISAAPDFILYQESGGIGEPSDDTVSEVKLKVSNSPVNGYFLSAQSGNNGGLTWAAPVATSCTGNSATATALATARTINGTSFDGTANITVTAAAGTLTGNTLNSSVTASSLTSLGDLSGLTVTGNLAVDTNTLFVNASTNRVGVGTSSPGENFEVASNASVMNVVTNVGDLDTIGRVKLGTKSVFGNRGPRASIDHIIRTDNYASQIYSSVVGISTATNTSGSLTQTALFTKDGLDVTGSITATDTCTISNVLPKLKLTDTNADSDFSIQNNNGVFSVKDETNSVERLSINSSGNVGIGTSSPTFSTFGSNTGGIEISDVGSGANALLVQSSSNEFFFANTSSANYIYGADNAPLIISTNGSERMRIKSDGTVGIGTTTPQKLLDVRGEFAISNSNASYWDFDRDDSDGSLKIKDTGTERLRIDSSGHLLLGTTTAGEGTADDFTIAGAGHTGMTIRSGSSSECNIFFADGTSGNARFRGMVRYFHDSDALAFNTSAVERLRINSSGNVGIGTTSPDALLDVVNTGGAAEIIVSSSTQPRLMLKTSGTTAECRVDFGDSGDSSRGAIGYNHSDDALKFYTTGVANERMRIDSSGHVRFGSSGDGFSSDWGHSTYGNTEVAIDGGGGYGVLHFRGDGAGSTNTRFSMGAGDDKFYMAYDDVDNRHNIVVTGTGNVGIGTSSPTDKLHVVGTSLLAGNSYVTGEFYIGADNKKIRIGAGQDLQLHHDGTDNIINSVNGDLIFKHSNNIKCVVTGGDFRPSTGNNIDLGVSSAKWQNVHAIRYYGDGSNLTGISGGKVIQQVSATKTDTASNSTGAQQTWEYNNSSLRVQITGSSTSNKFLFLGQVTVGGEISTHIGLRDGENSSNVTGMMASNDGNTRSSTSGKTGGDSHAANTVPIIGLIQVPDTNQHTYYYQFSHTSGSTQTLFINRCSNSGNNAERGRYISHLTVLEISA